MKTEFNALVKDFHSKALVSGDKGYSVKLQGEDFRMIDLAQAPANMYAKITIEWEEK